MTMPWRRRQVTHEETPPVPRRRPLIWPWLLLLLLLVAGLMRCRGSAHQKRFETARARRRRDEYLGGGSRELGQHGYTASVRSQAVAGTGAGKVLSQAPPAGTKLARGSRVTLVAGRGTRASGVPDLVGLPVDRAFVQLETAGLKGTTTRVASNRRPDIVLRQDPTAGTPAQKGSTVALTISKGGALGTVPRVVGLTEAAAIAKLTATGFQAGVSRVSSTKQSGLVISQKPAEGAQAARGSIVAIDVSGGPPTTTQTGTTTTQTGTTTKTPSTGAKVPGVVGMGQSAAFLQLAAGRVSRRLLPGDVEPASRPGRAPAPGGRCASCAQERRARRRVARFRPTAVSGRPRREWHDRDRRQALARAGGVHGPGLLPADDTTSGGDVVVDQKPSADARVRAGSPVAIYLGPPQ